MTNIQPYLRDCDGGKEWVSHPNGSICGDLRITPLTREHAAKLIYELADFLAGHPVHPKDIKAVIPPRD